MISESKAIEIINKYLNSTQESTKCQYFPVVASQIYGNVQLCEYLIDFLGDVYIRSGLDANYEENMCGVEIQEAIRFLAYCNGKVY